MSECARPVLPAKAAAGGGRRQQAAAGGAGSRCLHCISGARARLAFLCMYDIGTAKVIHMN